jgi:hypothetical protein
MKARHIKAALAFDGVEREPGGPPLAFRIWKAGDNTTDHGPTVLSERSIELLLEEQARRGNRYSIDVNHLSLDKTAPLENQRAVGWFSIADRDGDLWAVACEWTDVVRDGLSKDPPEWRYHSPAYAVDPETNEVISLTNLAITNTPATWSVTALASSGASKGTSRMKLEDIKAAFEGADDDAKKSAWAAIAKAMSSTAGDSDEGDEKKDAEDAPEKKDAKKASADDAEKKDSADDAEKKDSADEPEKKDSKLASLVAAQDKQIRAMRAELDGARKERESAERKNLIASRVMSDELAKTLASKPLEVVRDICAALPAKAAGPGVPEVKATRGATQGTGDGAQLPVDVKAKLDERMGLRKASVTIRNEGVHQIIPAMTPDEARAFLAAKQNGSK